MSSSVSRHSRTCTPSNPRAAKQAIRDRCEAMPHTHFIGTESIFLDASGKPKAELFFDDKLHLNEDGYGLWAAVIKNHLNCYLCCRFIP